MGELERRPNAWALTPLVVFLLTYLVVSIVAGDFYKMPITVAFVISSIVAIAISKGGKLSNRIEQFCRGAANSNIMLMVLIFILAGAFAQTAKAMGAVDATVNLAMSILPGNLLAAGIFLAACFISISVGTSVGTIVALAPVAVGIADKTGMPDALMLGVVVSGAMFGDNLSFISDTTIVATRTQGCQMSDKFKVNIRPPDSDPDRIDIRAGGKRRGERLRSGPDRMGQGDPLSGGIGNRRLRDQCHAGAIHRDRPVRYSRSVDR